jgi:hypothetical protein
MHCQKDFAITFTCFKGKITYKFYTFFEQLGGHNGAVQGGEGVGFVFQMIKLSFKYILFYTVT